MQQKQIWTHFHSTIRTLLLVLIWVVERRSLSSNIFYSIFRYSLTNFRRRASPTPSLSEEELSSQQASSSKVEVKQTSPVPDSNSKRATSLTTPLKGISSTRSTTRAINALKYETSSSKSPTPNHLGNRINNSGLNVKKGNSNSNSEDDESTPIKDKTPCVDESRNTTSIKKRLGKDFYLKNV